MRKSFSLIEMLVVIAILAILASMLMPALSRARDSAEAVQCASNFKQLSVAFYSFAADNNGRFPGRGNVDWGPNYTDTATILITWREILNISVFGAASGDREGARDVYEGANGIHEKTMIPKLFTQNLKLACPIVRDAEEKNGQVDADYLHEDHPFYENAKHPLLSEPTKLGSRGPYAANQNILGGVSTDALLEGPYGIKSNSSSLPTIYKSTNSDTYYTLGTRVDDFNNPSEKVLLQESALSKTDDLPGKLYTQGSTSIYIDYRHSKNTARNTIFVDGHVGLVGMEEDPTIKYANISNTTKKEDEYQADSFKP